MKKLIIFVTFFIALTPAVSAQMICPLPDGPIPIVNSHKVFEKIPVMEDGRVKPLDTYARNILLRFSGKKTYEDMDAIEWLSGMVFAHPRIREEQIFLINHPDIPDAISIEPEKRRRYSYAQLEEHIGKIIELAQKSSAVEEKSRSIVENELIRLESNIRLFIQLSNSFSFAIPHNDFTLTNKELKENLQISPDRDVFSYIEMVLLAGDLQEYLSKLEGVNSSEWSQTDIEVYTIVQSIFSWSMIYRNQPLHMMPVDGMDAWMSPWDFVTTHISQSEFHNEILFLADIFHYASIGKQLEFDLTIKSLLDITGKRLLDNSVLKRISTEILYNKWDLLLKARIAFLIAFIIFIISLALDFKVIKRCGLIVVYAGFFANLIAVIMRMIILQRPPVSNLYETFVFVSLFSALTGIFIEHFNRKGLGLAISGISGFAFLSIASKYAMEGDTMQMLVAVLNSNFWLSTHVITITIGYSATCVAGIIGHVYLLQMIFKSENKTLLDHTYKILIGTLGFSLVMSFLGTNLGGIWADQSWGRFWGWDPKENGALLIILWTAILFHARIANLIKPLGMAVGSILGIIVVMWAWFGVNLLNVGLHSYGFTHGLATNLVIYVVLQLLFIGITYPFAKAKNKL